MTQPQPRYPRDHLDAIRQRIPLAEMVGQYTELKPAGALLKGCCPIHVEKTPSFTVYPEDQHYHCFGCEAHGTVFDFVMSMRGIDFKAAVELLGHDAGLPAPGQVDPELESRRRREAETKRAMDGQERRQETDRVARMATRAVDDVARASAWQEHEYLLRKGFHPVQSKWQSRKGAHYGHGMVTAKGWLMVPMWNDAGQIRNAQYIDPEGQKLFHKGGEVKGLFHKLVAKGAGRDLWLVEGYATGLSVQWALLKRSLRPEIRACFSASNIETVGYAALERGRHVYVVADHDRWSCRERHRWDAPLGQKRCPECGTTQITPPAGEHHAAALERPYWMPPDPGDDANDYHVKHGLDALAGALRDFRYG